jgi:hypothetical protein
MDDKLLSALIGIFAGTIGYWFTTFWMKPILQYRELRSRVHSDLIFYAQVTNANGLSDSMKRLFEDRVTSNRRHSADLVACLEELPSWYKWWLCRKGQRPEQAARHLIGYSNTTDYDAADTRVAAIREALGFKAGVQ